MKKIIIALFLALSFARAGAQDKELLSITDEYNCPVTLTKTKANYVVAYSNYLYLGSKIHEHFLVDNTQVLKNMMASVIRLYSVTGDEENCIFSWKIGRGKTVFIKKINGEVFINDPRKNSSFYISSETAIKFLSAL